MQIKPVRCLNSLLLFGLAGLLHALGLPGYLLIGGAVCGAVAGTPPKERQAVPTLEDSELKRTMAECRTCITFLDSLRVLEARFNRHKDSHNVPKKA